MAYGVTTTPDKRSGNFWISLAEVMMALPNQINASVGALTQQILAAGVRFDRVFVETFRVHRVFTQMRTRDRNTGVRYVDLKRPFVTKDEKKPITHCLRTSEVTVTMTDSDGTLAVVVSNAAEHNYFASCTGPLPREDGPGDQTEVAWFD